MSLTVVKGLQSEIFVPVTPPPVWTPVTKELKDSVVALATAAGVHLKTDKRFNLRELLFQSNPWKYKRQRPYGIHMVDMITETLTKTSTVCSLSKDYRNLLQRKFIKAVAPMHFGFMGGGGDQAKFTNETGPEIAKQLKDENVDAVLLTAG